MEKNAFDLIQHPFIIKSLKKKIDTQENFLNTIKAIYDKATAKIMISERKLKASF